MKYLLPLILLFTTQLWAQIPTGYYNSASGLSGGDLQLALHDIIDGHQQQSYTALWTHFQTSDVKPNGKVWDMYSDIPGGTPPYEYTFVSDQCGNYSGEGSCYNREHSWPKSWFNEGYPMYSDMFHLVPTDGYVNGQRGNYPFGETNSPTWTSQNGSKKGPSSYPGYSGTIFEPINTYKGDFARNYFYMATRYLGEDGSWDSNGMVNGSQLLDWAVNMLMEWHVEDPVSQKEIDRNNVIYGIQNNRNPYIDHPEYVAIVWGGVSPGLDAPTNFTASNISTTTLDLSWQDNTSEEDGYFIYLDEALLLTLDPNIQNVEISELEAATSYTFGISAFNASQESSILSLNVTTSSTGGSTVIHFTEDFESGSGSIYIDGNISLISGTWNAFQAGNFSLGIPHSGDYCLAINDDKIGAQITTPAVNTLGTISFYYYQRMGSDSDEFQIQKSVNDGSFETLATQNYAVGENYTLYSLVVNDSASSVRIRVLNDNQAAHLILDDLTVTNYDPLTIGNEPEQTPSRMILSPAYPNPFNPSTTVSFSMPAGLTEPISLQIFDMRGRLVETLYNDIIGAGSHQINWSPTEEPSGVYFIKLSNSTESIFQRITYLR